MGARNGVSLLAALGSCMQIRELLGRSRLSVNEYRGTSQSRYSYANSSLPIFFYKVPLMPNNLETPLCLEGVHQNSTARLFHMYTSSIYMVLTIHLAPQCLTTLDSYCSNTKPSVASRILKVNNRIRRVGQQRNRRRIWAW